MIVTVKLFEDFCKFNVIKKGDWIDLHSAEDFEYKAPFADRLTKNKTVRACNFEQILVPLGIGMRLPKGFEAIIAPRSSSFKNFGFIQSNSIGIVDYSFSGPNDQWMLPIIPLKDGKINKGDRICQFKIQPSQKASWWQKLLWLFTDLEFEFVINYDGINRSGFGSTGV